MLLKVGERGKEKKKGQSCNFIYNGNLIPMVHVGTRFQPFSLYDMRSMV